MNFVRSIFSMINHRGGLLTIAAVSLGGAIQLRDGLFSWWAMLLLTIACLAAIAAIFVDRSAVIESLLFLAVALQLAVLLGSLPASDHESHVRLDYWPFYALIVAATVITAAAFVLKLQRFAFIACVLLNLAAGAWLIRFVPSPFMDVYVFQSESSRALLGGVNPYTIGFPDIYGSEGMIVYAPQVVHDGRVTFGFPYMPLTLLWDAAGHFLTGDYRYAQLVALAIAASLIAAIEWSRTSMLAALLLLFTPRSFYIVSQGWTEPLVVMLLALTVWSAARAPKLLPFALGLLLASKQYCVLFLLISPLLAARLDWKFIAKALATAAIMTLPLALWDFRAFCDSAVVLQFRQPFRTDALTIPAAIVQLGGPAPGVWISLLAAIAAAVFSIRKLPIGACGFASAGALVFLVFFALNKQAFANYYLLVIAAMCCAIASLKSAGPIVR